MSISLQTNVNSLVAQQNLNVTNKFQSQTITQLTSGYRINSSGDDAAGLAVANKFRSSVAELTQGVANGNDATAQLQIMDGGMSNISQILDRLKTLATQSASGTFTGDRGTLNSEFQADVGEIDRQAQSIGLDTGGTFAKNLSVYLGQGTGSGDGAGGVQALNNASVGVDLSQATVDAASLGLKGLTAIAGTVGAAGTDIGTGSSAGTTVADIVSSTTGNSQARTGYATFSFSGPGFSDSSSVSVQASLGGVSDTASLAAAINQGIANAALTNSSLKNAGIVASVNTDQFGHQQLAFNSSNTAFQVQAGDQMANALMGNFATAGSALGKAVTSTLTGGTAGASTDPIVNPTQVSVQISGAGLAGPLSLTLSSADLTVSDATGDLIRQVANSKQLQDAGISVAMTSDNKLQFSSATGASFNVSSIGDAGNALGLGTFVTTSALNGAAQYSNITAGASYSASATGNGVATLGFSLNGGATGGITAATVTGAITGTGYNGGGTPDGTVGNAAGALGAMTLTLNGSTTVTVDFTQDANQSGTESLQKAANFINSQIQSQAGYGSDVQMAIADTATNTIKLTGPADGAGTIMAAGIAADALGLSAAMNANIVAASGSAGNTVSVNLAGGDASGATITGSAAAPATIATGTNTMAFSVDGTTVNADFSNDVNAAGTAAAFTSSPIGLNGAASTLDVSALQGGAATVTGSVVGVSPASTLSLGGYAATQAQETGTNITGTSGTGASSVVDLSGFVATSASTVSAALGTGGTANPTITSLVSGFAAKAAIVTGGAIGTSPATLVGPGQAIDVSQFAATKASASGTTQLASTGLDFSADNAKAAVMSSSSAVAANGTDTVSALAGLDPTVSGNKLSISVSDGITTYAHTIDLHAAGNLNTVANDINTDTTLNAGGTHHVVASVSNGELVLTSGADLVGGATGVQNTITVAANAASQVLNLSTPGQIGNSTAQGANYAGLQLTVDTAATPAATTGTTALGTGVLSFTQYAATQAILTSGQISPTDTTANPDIAALDNTSPNLLKITVDATETDVDLTGDTTLDDVVSTITGLGITGLSATESGGVLTLTNSATAGAGHTISVANNNASQALSLGTTSASSADFVGVQVTVDGVAPVNVDISACTSASAIATAIGNAVHGATGGTSYVAANVAQADSVTGNLTITGKTTGPTGRVDIVENALTDSLGLTNSSSDTHATGAVAGNTTVNVNLTGVTTRANVVNAINNAVKAVNPSFTNVAVANTDGSIKITGATAGASGTVNIANNTLSNYLGFTSGSNDSDHSGTALQALTLNVDGGGAKTVDISGATSLANIVSDINTAVGGTPASATNGSLVIQGVTLGQGGSVDITDNAVSRALKLTTSGDVNQQGTAAQDLKLNVDGIGELDVNVSSCTNLTGIAGTGLAATINAAVTAAGGTYGSYGSVASATTDANSNGTITLASTATGAAASSVQVIDNAVSEALKFTAGTVTGKDPTKLDLNVDGLGQVAVNLSTLGTTGTLTDVANAINVAVAAAGHGYNGTYDSVAAAHAGTGSTGYLSLSGVSVGGSLSVTNNGMSKALGLVTGTADTNISGAAQTLNVQMDGKAQLKIDLSSLGNSAKLSDIAAKINTALVADTADYGAAYANAAQANPDGSITLTGVQGGGTLTVNNSAVSNTLGLTANTSNASNTGTAVQTLGISIDGKATTQISLAGIAGGKTPTLQDIADAINTQLTNDANYGASYANAQANSDGTITIASKGTGSAGGSVTVYNSAAGKALGLISGTAPSATMTGKDESVADAVSFLNTTAQQALGTSTDAQIVSLDSSGNVTISSQTTGKNSSVEVLSSGTTGGLNAALNLTGSVDKTTSGTARSLQSVVDSLKTAFNGNTTLQEAGLTAGINQGALEISSSNGTEFRADAWGTKVGSDLGFGTTGTAFNGANALTPKSTASTVDTQGASAIGTFANTKNSASISFQNMQFGNDDQSLTITANSAAGVAQTPLTVTLQNDDKAQTGANIDAAINTINTKLQQSESTTMRSITAVRETGADGSESINLISSLSSFNVSVSSSAGAAVGDGLNGGNATTLASAMNGTSSSIAIDTQAGAQQAVVALAAAVAKLGSAQASIGRGENQLGYAINLAQSQITNFSSAESQIRDTNVAQQAANLSKAQVLSQAAIAAMAQANSAPQGVLALLRG